jgi:single-stranded DNA-binding protein
MSINIVVQSGVVQNLALRYNEQGKPELRFALQQTEQTADGRDVTLYLQCCALGAASERLASEIEDGQHIVITSGKLCYRKRQTKQGVEQSRMEVLVWSCERLTTSPQDQSLGPGEGESQGNEAASAPEPPKKRARYQKWKPSAVVEPN